jgi:hypothetical protein
MSTKLVIEKLEDILKPKSNIKIEDLEKLDEIQLADILWNFAGQLYHDKLISKAELIKMTPQIFFSNLSKEELIDQIIII